MSKATAPRVFMPHHHRMPFILRTEQLGAWLSDGWLPVLENPDRAPLDKIQNP